MRFEPRPWHIWGSLLAPLAAVALILALLTGCSTEGRQRLQFDIEFCTLCARITVDEAHQEYSSDGSGPPAERVHDPRAEPEPGAGLLDEAGERDDGDGRRKRDGPTPGKP